jgi:hypothetical protein
MNSFFVLSSDKNIAVDAQYAGYVIFYRKSKDAVVAEIQTSLYTKLIENALKLKLVNFLFIDINTQKVRFSGIKKALEIRKCFLFGVDEKEVGINFDIPPYHLTALASVEFLKADAPEKLESDKHLKNKLWTQLQTAFKLHS